MNADRVVKILEENKAEEISVYDVSTISPLADAFVVATGVAARHLDALAEALRFEFKGAHRRNIEGDGTAGWVLVDLGDIVAHLLTAERRRELDLDGLWAATIAARERGKS